MTNKELEKLFLDFANSEEISQAKNKIKNILKAGRIVKPAWKFLLPAAAAAALAVFVIFYMQGVKHEKVWEPKIQYVSVYDSPMYVYLVNSIYERGEL